MKNLLANISIATNALWLRHSTEIGEKHGKYRYSLGVNGLGEVILTDFRLMQDVAKGNRAVQKKIKELAR
jgi:hypothetical protein